MSPSDMEIEEPVIQFEFKCCSKKQALLIDSLLKYSKVNLETLAYILDVSSQHLLKVYRGYQFLKGEQAVKLARLFLIFFEDEGFCN